MVVKLICLLPVTCCGERARHDIQTEKRCSYWTITTQRRLAADDTWKNMFNALSLYCCGSRTHTWPPSDAHPPPPPPPSLTAKWLQNAEPSWQQWKCSRSARTREIIRKTAININLRNSIFLRTIRLLYNLRSQHSYWPRGSDGPF